MREAENKTKDDKYYMTVALRKLGIRDYSEGEIRKTLRDRGADKEAEDRVIGKLREYGYLDDARAARASLVRSFSKNKSLRQAKREAMERGLREEDIEEIW